MNKSLITPTFLKQQAKKLKKERSISWHQALEATAIKYGFSNYKHFLNDWESDHLHESRTAIGEMLKMLSSEKDMTKKIETAIPFVQSNIMSFPEMFDIFEQFSQSREAVQTVCENSFFLDRVVGKMLLEYFRQSKSDVQALPSKQHFVAKNVVIESLECELITERLNVNGLYTIEFDFEFLSEVEENMRGMSHFNCDPMFGQFQMTIDRNKQITIANPTIGEINEDGIFVTHFKLAKVGSQ